MKTNRIRTGVLAAMLAGAMFAGVVQAGNSPGHRVADIVSQQQQIRADVAAEKNGWDNIPVDKRKTLITKQDELMLLIDGKQDLDQLSPADRAAAVEKLEWIDALVTAAANERQVCRRERRTGTHRTQLVCRSAGDMTRQREQAKDAWRQGKQNLMPRKPPPGQAL